MRYRVVLATRKVTVEVSRQGHAQLLVDEVPEPVDLVSSGDGLSSLLAAGHSYEVALVRSAASGALHLLVGGVPLPLHIEDERIHTQAQLVPASRAQLGALEVKSPMPGRILSVPVQPGDAVTDGQVLAVLEAMKMESNITAPHAGKVRHVNVSPGQPVLQQQTLLVLDPSIHAAK